MKRSESIKAANELRKSVVSSLLTLANPPRGMSDDVIIVKTEEAETVLATISFKPWQEGFSDSDLSFYVGNLKSRIDYNREQVHGLKKADQDLIQSVGFRLQGLSKTEREAHRVMRDHRSILSQIRSRELFIDRALAVTEVIEAEQVRRTELLEAQKAEIAQRHAEWEARNEEALKASRRMNLKERRIAKKIAPKTARNEIVLKGFGELVAMKRKAGHFTTEVKILKADAAERLGGVDQLASAFEEAKVKGSEVIATLNDGRQICYTPKGSRYFERA